MQQRLSDEHTCHVRAMLYSAIDRAPLAGCNMRGPPEKGPDRAASLHADPKLIYGLRTASAAGDYASQTGGRPFAENVVHHHAWDQQAVIVHHQTPDQQAAFVHHHAWDQQAAHHGLQGAFASRMSHSCTPNCQAVVMAANGKLTIALYTLRQVLAL